MKILRKCLLSVLVSCFFFQIEAFATNAPSNLVATGASSSQVNLTWTDNSTNETGFTFAFDTNSGLTSATYVYAGGVNTTSYSHTGRSAATTYFYKIKAEGSPDSAWSSVKSATTAPANLAASVVSSSQINLTWTGNSGNSNIHGYTIGYATNSSFSGAVYHYVSGVGATSFNHTGLYAGTTYYYKIKAEGSTSDTYDSPYAPSISATTSNAAPNAPSGLAASVASNSQINLSWTDNSSNETGFEVKRATDSGFTQNVTWIGNIQVTTYSNTGLSASTTYYYKVRAEGAMQDSAYSSSVSATTSASGTIPNAPSGLSATAVASTQVNLSWTDNSSNETGFEVKRATDSGFTQNVIWIGAIQGSTYSNTGLSPSTTYYYKVRAEGTAGKSAYSSSVSVTTPGAPSSGIPISPHFAGINAWMPYQIGSHKYYGKLETKWSDIQASGARIMRYGGNGVDQWADPTWGGTMGQYVTMVDAMRSQGIEPVLQVPVYGGAYSSSQAADIVRYVNITNGRAVKYWVIGNEPDLASGPYAYTSATEVAGYFKPFASAMKEVDPTIKIIGPETTWYHDSIFNGLTSCDGGADDITGTDGNGNTYVDILSFHIYGFDGSQTMPAQVISKLMASGGFNDDLGTLRSRMDACNSYHGRTGGNALQMAVTEANVDHENPSGDDVDGLGAKSFIGGQFWAELMGIAMQRGVDFVTFWSTIEGDELGYLSGDGTTRRPSYYHFQMMAQSFRGSSVTTTDNQANVKAFGSEDVDQIAVMIMNQDQSSSFNYRVRLNTSTVSGSNPLKINVDAGVAVEYSGTIATESSLVLVFDAAGAIKKKIEYKLNGHADSNLPPVVTNY